METPKDYAGLVDLIIDLINIIIPTLFGIIFVYFVWKMIDAWVLHAGEESSRAEGKKYATVAIVVFVFGSIAWGLVNLIRNTLFGI